MANGEGIVINGPHGSGKATLIMIILENWNFDPEQLIRQILRLFILISIIQ
jgi:ABC-type lipoprotein export system ATPase subunit